jgi:predicted nucleic acid-binding protein
MENKQTAVEWFAEHIQEQLNVFLPGAVLDEIMLNKAKEMEKQQAVNFGYDIADDLACGALSKKAIEDKYNETYKKEE